jgi:hypothetical protein
VTTEARRWWYLWFADEIAFRGGCFVLASDIENAVSEATELGCAARTTSGSALGFPLESAGDIPPWRLRNRLLSQADLNTCRVTAPSRPTLIAHAASAVPDSAMVSSPVHEGSGTIDSDGGV